MKNKLRVLLGMDGVLVDFDSGVAPIFGLTPEELAARREPGHWSLVEPLGVTVDAFWEAVNSKGEDFWRQLQPLPWHRELIHMVELITKDWHIVTAPSRAECSYTGKVKWLKKYFGHSFDRFVICPHKELFANPFTVLVDDREENLIKFLSHGGRGVLFASLGNSLHPFRNEPCTYLLDRILESEPIVEFSNKEPKHAFALQKRQRSLPRVGKAGP